MGRISHERKKGRPARWKEKRRQLTGRRLTRGEEGHPMGLTRGEENGSIAFEKVSKEEFSPLLHKNDEGNFRQPVGGIQRNSNKTLIEENL